MYTLLSPSDINLDTSTVNCFDNPNCNHNLFLCSLRSQSERNQHAAFLTDYDVDEVLGCEYHIDHSFLSSTILLPN